MERIFLAPPQSPSLLPPLSLLLPPSSFLRAAVSPLPPSSFLPPSFLRPAVSPLPPSLRPAVFPLPSFPPPPFLSSSLRPAVFPLPLFLPPPFPPLSPLPSRNNTRCKNEIFHPVRMKYHAHRADIGQTPHQMLKKPSILKKIPQTFCTLTKKPLLCRLDSTSENTNLKNRAPVPTKNAPIY